MEKTYLQMVLDKQEEFKLNTGIDFQFINDDGNLTQEGCLVLVIIGLDIFRQSFRLIENITELIYENENIKR